MNACICEGCGNRFHSDDVTTIPIWENESMVTCYGCARIACAQAHSDMGASMDEDAVIDMIDARWYTL